MFKDKYQRDKNQKFIRVNDYIRLTPIILIDENGQNLGSIPLDEAKLKARKVNLDLVEVSANTRPPVCRIMDFGKYKYELALKEKKQRQNQKQNQTKEMRLSPVIADNDIITKAKTVAKFLSEGHKVQLRLEFKKRANAHKELGFEVVKKMLAQLNEVGQAVAPPKLEGKFLLCLIEPRVEK